MQGASPCRAHYFCIGLQATVSSARFPSGTSLAWPGPMHFSPMKKVPARKKRIIRSGADRQISHRANFHNCPSCDHRMETQEWDDAAVTLVLEPWCYKAGCVSIVSECPKCFELSWLHKRMWGFQHDDTWPDTWKLAVMKQEAAVKLQALREWGAGICHGCQHLKSGTVEHHAWRDCIKGTGRPVVDCDKYGPFKTT